MKALHLYSNKKVSTHLPFLPYKMAFFNRMGATMRSGVGSSNLMTLFLLGFFCLFALGVRLFTELYSKKSGGHNACKLMK